MNTAIQTNQLTKAYKEFHAVDGVSIKVDRGEIYGFIGLNGAGKTTTIRMLLGMLRPTRGSCFINGEQVSLFNHRIWDKVGYMVETPHSYPELTVEENLEIYRRLRLISDQNAVTKVMRLLNLSQYANKKAKNLSLGNAQRLGIAKAFLPDPNILILDEPVNGLDPAGIVEIRELLHDLAFNKGVAILISSHLLSEVAKIATKIGILDQGQLIEEIESHKLNQLLHQQLLVDTHDNEAAIAKLSSTGYTSSVINDNGLIEIGDSYALQHPDAISRLLVYEGLPPIKLSLEEEDLESYFLRTIRRNGEKV